MTEDIILKLLLALASSLLAADKGLALWHGRKPNGSAGSQPIDFWKLQLQAAIKAGNQDSVQLLRDIKEGINKLVWHNENRN